MTSPIIPPLKRCTKCGEEKPATTENFRRDKTRKDGLFPQCKTCTRKDGNEYRAKNIDRERARTRDWGRQNAERNRTKAKQWYYDNHERARETRQDYYLSHKQDWLRQYHIRMQDPAKRQQRRDTARKYADNNRHRIREMHREWLRKNPEAARIGSRRRRARRRNAEGKHTHADVKLQYASQRGLCWWCGVVVGDDYEADHRIPLSRGGSDKPENICISCKECNRSKYNKLPHEWGDRLL